MSIDATPIDLHPRLQPENAIGDRRENFFKIPLAPSSGIAYITFSQADMAQLVEHNLAKVGVAGSSPVVRSIACLRADSSIGPLHNGEVAKW